MLCFSAFELNSRWVPLIYLTRQKVCNKVLTDYQNTARIGFLRLIQLKQKLLYFRKKSSRKSTMDKHNFTVSKEHIEIVNNYTYLGVKFSANGNFTNHKENFTEKNKEVLFCRSSLSRCSEITNSHHQQTVQYTIFSNFNVLLRSLGNL